jgi:hypothetical protein
MKTKAEAGSWTNFSKQYQNLDQVANFRSGRVHSAEFGCSETKRLNLKLETRPKTASA